MKLIDKIRAELKAGMNLAKCKKCGCMKNTLDNLQSSLPAIKDSSNLLRDIESWLKQMKPITYSCLGCKHCFPAVALNIFNEAFPESSNYLSCDFPIRKKTWPAVPGEYFEFCEGSICPTAVSTLASIELAENLADKRPNGLCIVGKTETENIGIDKIIKNTITNPAIHFLIVTGKDPKGHYSGKTLLALAKNGVNKNMRIIGSPGKRPILRNVSSGEIESFRRQIKIIDMIGCENVEMIIDKIDKLLKEPISICKYVESKNTVSTYTPYPSRIIATKSNKLKMDRAGYFVVIPSVKEKIITVEYYSYDNKLLHIIEGKDAPSIYSTIIENGWITELSHASYLGRELGKAEVSIKYGFKYVQDKA